MALLILVCAVIALRGAVLLHDHSLHSIDGAMQTWFALDNFASGRQLGAEFQSYLGIVMILALLPAFWALGETLFASTMAAQMLVILGAIGSAYGVVWMVRWIAPARRWMAAIILVFGFYYVGAWLAAPLGLTYPLLFEPGVSLRPVRGLLPVLVLPVFVIALRRIMRARDLRTVALSGAGLGLVAGAGLLWSNDAGIPLVIALAIGLASALLSRFKQLIAAVSGFVLACGASAAAILVAVTHGEPEGWLHYNFIAVAGDQFWYFAPWERESRVLSLIDLWRIPLGGEPLSVLSLLLLTACVLLALAQRLRGRGDPLRKGAFIFVGSSLIGTALIPQIGGHIGGEYNHITFLLGLCAPLILWQAQVLRLVRSLVKATKPALALLAVGAASVIMIGVEGIRLTSTFSASERSIYAESLGFYVTPNHAADLAAMERLSAHWDEQGVPEDLRLLSVYTSTLDIAAGTESPSPVGSLIHALGPKYRADFAALVSEAEVEAVTTIAPDYSGWEGWVRRANWHVFRALIENYEPIARNDQQVLWVRRAAPIEVIAEARCAVASPSNNALVLSVESEQPGWASLTLQRQHPFGQGRTALLTVSESSPATARAKGEPWSDFPRYGSANSERLELFAPVEPGQATTLTLEVLDRSDIGAASCTAKLYQAPDFETLESLPKGVDRYLAERGQ